MIKIRELRILKQGKMVEKHIKVFEKIVRDSKYKKRALIEEFKKNLNEVVIR